MFEILLVINLEQLLLLLIWAYFQFYKNKFWNDCKLMWNNMTPSQITITSFIVRQDARNNNYVIIEIDLFFVISHDNNSFKPWKEVGKLNIKRYFNINRCLDVKQGKKHLNLESFLPLTLILFIVIYFCYEFIFIFVFV